MRRHLAIITIILATVLVAAPAAQASKVSHLRAKVVRLRGERDQARAERDEANARAQLWQHAYATGWISLGLAIDRMARDDAPVVDKDGNVIGGLTEAEQRLVEVRRHVSQLVAQLLGIAP